MNTLFPHSLIFTNLFPLAIAIYFLLLANIRESLCNSSGVMTLNVSKKEAGSKVPITKSSSGLLAVRQVRQK